MRLSIDKILFSAAATIAEPEERTAFLDYACRDDPALRRLLDEMLEMEDAAEDFFEPPPASEPEPGSESLDGVNARIGRYRLIERIGAGGYGVVYLAEQQEPVRRKVALKIVRLGMDTENVIARFQMERQALATMDHPNIARVLDAGATDSGRPYFVMELVEGEKITDFCDAHRLDLKERLELFVQVCQAVQHAHQKGVIHRDIKPSNVLVRSDAGLPVPKIIDFGIAKATADIAGHEATFTAFEQFIGTPAYMSPEQAAGVLDVDTRSDIHSLGVLLYELVVGRPPFDFFTAPERSLEEMRRILRDEEPPKPSSRLTALTVDELRDITASRRSESHKLIQTVKGDLDWIAMKAMEKDRNRRYETANGLALDVQRHLRNEPVSAGPPGRGYLLGKMVRRNKPVFLAGGLALLALFSGLAGSTWMFFRERDAHNEQQRLRQMAESARSNADRALASEAELRKHAEYRETLAQAAVKLAHNDMAGADAMLAAVPVDLAPSSLEAATSYRVVGEWHMKEGRWDQAAARFVGLARAMSSVDPSDSETVSRNLLQAAAALCRLDDRRRYEQFRRMAVERFGKSGNVDVAEQVVKATLLKPADEDLLKALKPLGILIERDLNSMDDPARNRGMVAWRHLSLTLFHYREGDLDNARVWANRCLQLPEANAARNASAGIIIAMIEARSGRPDNARRLIDVARPRVREKLSGRLEQGGSTEGYWFDWVNAGSLLDEAAALVNEGNAE